MTFKGPFQPELFYDSMIALFVPSRFQPLRLDFAMSLWKFQICFHPFPKLKVWTQAWAGAAQESSLTEQAGA